MDNLADSIGKILSENPLKIVVSNPAGQPEGFVKIVFTQKAGGYQAEKFTKTQAFHQNVSGDGLYDELVGCMGSSFLQLNSFHGEYEYGIRITRKGKVLLNRSRSQAPCAADAGHDRKKKYIFEQGQIIEPLVDMGIFTKEGKVVQSMYDKYRQINRFVEMIDDEIRDSGVTHLSVVDFGCGKSYLTFLLYYYFHYIKGVDAAMTGLDLKEDVIEKCNSVARKYGYDRLRFRTGDIRGYRPDGPVDMVIALHACDTATDHALLHAVLWNAKMIFSVPCCQHEINHQMDSERFSLLTRYGIIREHVSAAFTDAIRANLLLCCGYKTQLLEFVDAAHTPRNILIRAVRSHIPDAVRMKALDEVMRLKDEFSLEPTLLSLMRDAGLLDGTAC